MSLLRLTTAVTMPPQTYFRIVEFSKLNESMQHHVNRSSSR